jgi:hypothetical protein
MKGGCLKPVHVSTINNGDLMNNTIKHLILLARVLFGLANVLTGE